MQPMAILRRLLDRELTGEHYLFAATDLAAALGRGSKVQILLSRAASQGLVKRVCKGIYLNPRAEVPGGRVLFHAAARLRVDEFNYISCETSLSDAGAISQIPINWITIMTSGRSHTVDCGAFGHIEFIHTRRKARDVADALTYDPSCRLWRASVAQAMRDMRATRRDMSLVNTEDLS